MVDSETYTAEEYYTEEHHRKLQAMCEKHHFESARLRYFTIPTEKFDEYVDRFIKAGG